MKDSLQKIPLRTALIYFLIAGFYIFVSDRLLVMFIEDVERLILAQTYKGWLFVFVTSIFLYWDLHRKIRTLTQEKEISAKTKSALEQSEINYRNMANYSPFAKFVDLDGKVVYVNQACADLLGAPSPEDLLGKESLTFYPPELHERVLVRRSALKEVGQAEEFIEERIVRLDGREVPVEISRSVFPYQNQPALHVHLRNISGKLASRQKIKQQLLQLQSLREIDQVILNSFDLESIVRVSLKHFIDLLEVDAVNLILPDKTGKSGRSIGSLGFRKAYDLDWKLGVEDTRFQKLLIDRKPLCVQNLLDPLCEFIDASIINNDQFISYYGVPLKAKGRIKGILEIFQRTPLDFSDDQMDLLGTLTNQLAIAIDDTELYKGLQRSLIELSLAYDTTIEGWSHAMDMRDKDTEGHSQRVTDHTMRLARLMGMSEEDLVHIRRGALLHDIGKLNVPDSILQKPAALTEEEWDIMRQHPQFAFNMLQPVSYLRPALDIPYCHHEKWDGTGYPRGLEGNHIPLSARIFAVVDVWFALSSDRPYRDKWPQNKVLDYIRENSGTHFDPQVVEKFFTMLNQMEQEDQYP